MANTVIQLRNSTVTGNVPSSLANGEISINSRDGKFFYSTPAGAVITHYPYLGPAGLNKEIQFNDSGTLGSNSGLAFDKTSGSLNVSTTLNVSGKDLGAYANAAFLKANTPDYVANSASSYANGAFLQANAAFTVANNAVTSANGTITWNTANAAFTRANNSLDANNGGTVTGTITATSFITSGSYGNIQGANTVYANNFVANTGYFQFSDGSKQYTANAGSGGASSDTYARNTANAAFIQANAAFAQANTGGAATDGWARGQANAAFNQANTAQSTASSAAAAASSAQSTADAAYNTYDFASIYTPNNSITISASNRSDTLTIVGESGVAVWAKSGTKTIAIAGTPGAQGMTVDYGFVADPLYYAIDYGTL